MKSSSSISKNLLSKFIGLNCNNIYKNESVKETDYYNPFASSDYTKC